MIESQLSPLVLLHPDGSVDNAVVLGEGLPPLLVDGLMQANESQEAGLIVVGPSVDHGAAARVLRELLSRDGVAYLMLRPRARRRLARRAGLKLTTALLHLGPRSAPRFVVPTERRTARWALRTLTASRRAALARAVPFLLDCLAPAAVARRPGARPLAQWLRGEDGDVVLARSTALLVKNGTLAAVAKVGNGAVAEVTALEHLGPSARAAGAAVPHPLRNVALARPSVIETPTEGLPAATILSRRPRALEPLLLRLSNWLTRWNVATAVDATFSRELLERKLLEPARLLELPAAYTSWLERRCAGAEGTAITLVATHNDLTTANILVSRSGPLGIVDWETAESGGLPLTDLFYALADAQAASDRFRDRSGAFLACFASPGQALERTRSYERRIADAIPSAAPAADLCFHACWLGHAANEARGNPGERPFGEIARLVADRGLRMGE